MHSALVDRTAARVLLLDAHGAVLLLHGLDPAEPDAGTWWFTPGGGLEPGEEPASGAARELFEETGLSVPPDQFHGPVYERVAEFGLDGVRYRQREWFYVARADRWEIDTSGFTDLERRSIDGHRWWTPAELATTTETVYPEVLIELLASLPPAGAGA
jgi:8-oxo-dGTP pyrophosphatase MutT (NUDIX family)